MGTKTSRPDTDPEMQRMIDRYVNDALVATGMSELAHGRLARASVPPQFDFLAPPPVDPAAELVRELAAAMGMIEPRLVPDPAFIVAPVPEPREFVDESPTDRDDDEPTGVFSPPRR